jgi:hypothetical protein
MIGEACPRSAGRKLRRAAGRGRIAPYPVASGGGSGGCGGGGGGGSGKDREEAKRKWLAALLLHASSCGRGGGCTSVNCKKVQVLFAHSLSCRERFGSSCAHCQTLRVLVARCAPRPAGESHQFSERRSASVDGQPASAVLAAQCAGRDTASFRWQHSAQSGAARAKGEGERPLSEGDTPTWNPGGLQGGSSWPAPPCSGALGGTGTGGGWPAAGTLQGRGTSAADTRMGVGGGEEEDGPQEGEKQELQALAVKVEDQEEDTQRIGLAAFDSFASTVIALSSLSLSIPVR